MPECAHLEAAVLPGLLFWQLNVSHCLLFTALVLRSLTTQHKMHRGCDAICR